MFRGKTVAIATIHGKEKVVASQIQNLLKMETFVPNINADVLGTFSGSIERKLSALESARAKCRLAFLKSTTDHAIASEGSFGYHSNFPF